MTAAQDSRALKPCPFCGSESVVMEQYKADGLRIICKNCAVKREQRTMRKSIDWLRDEMIADWNRRAALSAEPVAEVACTHVQGWCTRWIEVDGKRNIPPLGTKLYAAPQPAAQKRKPATASRDCTRPECMSHGCFGHCMRKVVQAAERAHGITGEHST